MVRLGILLCLLSVAPSWALHSKKCNRVSQFRNLTEAELKSIPSTPIEYIDNKLLHARFANHRFVTLAPSPPQILPDTDKRELYLDRDTEYEWFARMNYYKLRAENLRQKLHQKGNRKDYDEFLYFTLRALEVRKYLQLLNQGLVGMITKKFISPTVTYDDLQGEGQLFLINAIEKFDLERGYRFSTFASNCLFRGLLRYKSNSDKHTARETTGATDEVGFLAADTATAKPGSDFADDRQMKFLRTSVESLMDSVTDLREKEILARRFGLDGGEPETLKVIAESLGITKERVRQIETRALKRLLQRARELAIDID